MLLVTLFVFAPRFVALFGDDRQTYEWSRATSFLRQAGDPLTREVEPAMRMRLLPTAVAHFSGLRGHAALALPFLGVVCALAYVGRISATRFGDLRVPVATSLLVATSSAMLVPLHWLGINDAWAWLGLLCVAFGRSTSARVTSLLLAPWVDERFLLALPLALAARELEQPGSFRRERWLLAALAPYATTRIWLTCTTDVGQINLSQLDVTLRFAPMLLVHAPIGWWMAWRLGWWPALQVVRTAGWRVGALVLATLLVGTLLAWDLSRSAAMLLPLVVLGSWQIARASPDGATKLGWIALANLLIPAAHVVGSHIALINPLVVEVARVIRDRL